MLANRVDVHHWANVFPLGEYNLQALQREAAECDFGVFIWGTEDKSVVRKKASPAPRDNVVYEAGLFAGALGELRVFVIHAENTKIPSDYLGVTTESFDPKAPNIERIAERICSRVEDLGPKPVHRLVGYWWQLVLTDEDSSIVSFVRVRPRFGGRSVDIGGHSWTAEGRLVARWDSTATQFDEESETLRYSWEGKHHRETGVPLYFGVGKLRYGLSPVVGQYSSTKRHEGRKPERTRHKSAVYLPAAQEDVETMTGTDAEARKSLINYVLQKRASFE
jgi:hypothetical protein